MSSRALGYQQIVGLAASTALTVPAGTAYALVIAEAQAVRWRDDGTAPTSTVGMPLAVGVEERFDSSSFSALRFIQQAATANLNVAYYSGD